MSKNLIAAGMVALAVGGFGLVGPASAAEQASAKEMSAAEFMAAANTNKDETLSKDEVDSYAKKKFAEINADNDKTLDQKELQGRIGEAGMAAADPDHDKTIDEAEFLGYANKLFEEANINRKAGKDTLSMKELETPAGAKLRMLLR